MYALEGLPASRQFAADRFDRRCPHERLRLLVPGFEELVDRPLEVGDADEGAAANAFAGELSEPSFHQVEPARAGRDEVRHEARMTFEPGLHLGMLVRAVVVEHQMEGGRGGELAIEAAQEAQELLVPVAGASRPIAPNPSVVSKN